MRVLCVELATAKVADQDIDIKYLEALRGFIGTGGNIILTLCHFGS